MWLLKMQEQWKLHCISYLCVTLYLTHRNTVITSKIDVTLHQNQEPPSPSSSLEIRITAWDFQELLIVFQELQKTKQQCESICYNHIHWVISVNMYVAHDCSGFQSKYWCTKWIRDAQEPIFHRESRAVTDGSLQGSFGLSYKDLKPAKTGETSKYTIQV